MVTDFTGGQVRAWSGRCRPVAIPTVKANSTAFIVAESASRASRLGGRHDVGAVQQPAGPPGALVRDRPGDDGEGGLLRAWLPPPRELADQPDQPGLRQEAQAVHVRPRQGEAALRAGRRQARHDVHVLGPAGRRDEWITMAQILQQDLQKIGLNLTIVRSDVEHVAGEVLPGREEVPGAHRRQLLLAAAEPVVRVLQVQYGACECNWNNAQFEASPRRRWAPRTTPHGARSTTRCRGSSPRRSPVMVIAHPTNIIAVPEGDHRGVGGRAR